MDKRINSIESKIDHLQKKLIVSKLPESKINYLKRLAKIPMTEDLLRSTGIGQTVCELTSAANHVGEAAFEVMNKWRLMIMQQYAEKDRSWEAQRSDRTAGQGSSSSNKENNGNVAGGAYKFCPMELESDSDSDDE